MRVEAFETDDGGIAVLYVIPWGDSGLEEFEDWDEAFVFLAELGIDTDDYKIEDYEDCLD